jgi:hypothetical protein
VQSRKFRDFFFAGYSYIFRSYLCEIYYVINNFEATHTLSIHTLSPSVKVALNGLNAYFEANILAALRPLKIVTPSEEVLMTPE